MKRLVRCPTILSVLTGLRLLAAGTALVAVATAFPGCCDCPDCPSAGSRATQLAPAADDGGQSVAVAAFQAIFSGDESGFLRLVRPDETPGQSFDKYFQTYSAGLAGCKTEGAQVLVEQQPDVNPSNKITLILTQPCGVDSLGHPYRKCGVQVIQLSGRWYIDGAESWGCFSQ